MGQLAQLTTLDISWCKHLKTLPDSFGWLSSLQSLNLKSLDLEALPDSFGLLSSLQNLTLTHCLFEGLPNSFGQLSSLCDLKLISCPNLRALPNSFGSLLSLCDLDVSYCPCLVHLPGSLGRLSSLCRLTIMRAESPFPLSAWFEQLSSLQEVALIDMRMTALPTSLLLLPALESLQIYSAPSLTTLVRLPARKTSSHGGRSGSAEVKPQGTCLPALRALSLSSCSNLRPQQLHENLRLMSSLTYLFVYRCEKLLALPDSQGDLSALHTLTLLDLRLNVLPHNFCHLSALTFLSVSTRHLAALPSDLGNFRKLEDLRISSSILEALPDSLGQLRNLSELWLLQCTQLRNLPDSFTQLVSLKRLTLVECTSLVKLPLVDGQLPGRCLHLEVKVCPLLELPDRYHHCIVPEA